MRDILFTVIVLGSLPVILFRPYVGILVFAWLGYFNPQKLSWGFATDIPFSLMVALTTLVALAFSNERKRIPITGLTVAWLLFIVWMGITTVFAFYPDAALVQYERVLKIQLMSFAVILLITNEKRLQAFVWVIVMSLAFYGIKGGIFTVLTKGTYRVWGPDGTFIGGNNEVALALLMTLPLMHYLRITSRSRLIRLGLLIGMVLCGFSIVGSQSRGALVGGVAMVMFLWAKSRHKLASAAALVLVVSVLVTFMPEQWRDRMSTIETYQNDSSAMGRIQVWKMTLNLASHNPLGGGFEMWTEETFDRYSPDHADPHDGHSIYFKVLGEHGWLGLALFLFIALSAWRTASSIIKQAARNEKLKHLSDLARMTQVSLAAFAVGGAFLGLSYFDLYWNLVAILVVAKSLIESSAPRSVSEPAVPAATLAGNRTVSEEVLQ
jgi:probable O-glycosylation ligase (exosortase A-associated)